MGARMVPANGQTTKTKKNLIYRFGWKDFPFYYKYIHSRAIFVLERGDVLLLGHIRYIYLVHVYRSCIVTEAC